MRSSTATRAALILSSALLVPSIALAQGDYTAPRSANVNASGARTIRIANGSGRLTVTGSSTSSVRVSATAHAGSRGDLDHVRLVAERQGDEIVVHPDMGDDGSYDCNCWMDLTVEIPSNVALEVRDGSGGAEIRNVGAVNVASGSGGVRIDGTSGSVEMRSGSGHATATNVHGDVRASTGSGGLTLQQITGSVEIEHAGSGGVSLRNVSGSVHVGSIGSGSIDAQGVGGDLTVDHQGSGGVHYASVRGKVSLPDRY